MANPINEESVDYLARLARLELYAEEKEKFTKDLGRILEYFEELRSLDTSGVPPVNGGTRLTNIFREDEERLGTLRGAGKEQFPKSEGDYLVVPKVFEEQ